jgi:hypothetical protein
MEIEVPTSFMMVRPQAPEEFWESMPMEDAADEEDGGRGESGELGRGVEARPSAGECVATLPVPGGGLEGGKKDQKTITDLDGRPWSICSDSSRLQERKADNQLMMRMAPEAKHKVTGILSSFTFDTGAYHKLLLAVGSPFYVRTAEEDHLTSAGVLASRLADSEVVINQEKFKQAVTGVWTYDGAGGGLSLRDFHPGGRKGFPLAMSDRSATTACRLLMTTSLNAVGNFYAAVADPVYEGAFQPVVAFLERPDNPLHSAKNLVVFAIINGALATLFTQIRTLNRVGRPMCGSASVLGFVAERMEATVKSLEKLAAAEGASMESHFFERDLPRMGWGQGRAGAPRGRRRVRPRAGRRQQLLTCVCNM